MSAIVPKYSLLSLFFWHAIQKPRLNLRSTRTVVHRILLYTALLLPTFTLAAPTQWQVIAPGLEYTKLPLSRVSNQGILHAFRIDPLRYDFNLVFANDYKLVGASVRRLSKLAHVNLAINGGFFDADHIPLGLRIQNKKIRNRLKNISWWDVFILINNKPLLISHETYQRDYRNNNRVDFAIQAGPPLLINNQIQPLKDGFAERSAIGYTLDGKVIIVCTQNAPITTKQLANILRTKTEDGGLATTYALNLDGGSSSQLYAKYNQFYVSVPNFGAITDAITVKPK